MNDPLLVTQIDGVIDDGSEAGVIRAAIARGDLIQHPFIQGQYYLTAAVGGSGATFAGSGHFDNTDGLGGLVRLAATQGLPTNVNSGARLYVAFTGRVFGIRFRRDTNTPDDFSVSVDGVAVGVRGKQELLNAEGEGLVDGDGVVITHENLSEGAHSAWITVHGRASASWGLEMFGYLVEPRSGYKNFARQGGFHKPAATPTGAAAAVSVVSNGTGFAADPRRLSAIRGILYYNTTVGSITVTVSCDGATIWSAAVGAGASATCDLLMPVGSITWVDTVGESALKHVASGAGLNYTVIGAF